MRRLARTQIVVLAAAVLLLVAGCASTEATLEGTSWKLTEWTVSSLNPADYDLTAAFVDGRISGTSAVNSYGGAYAAGPGDAFATGELVMTLMAGPEPAMRAERVFLELLRQVARYEVGEGRLTLSDEHGNVMLIFEPR